MHWVTALFAAAIALAGTLVLVRYRWGTERVLVAAFLAAVALVVAGAALGVGGTEMPFFFLIPAVLGGVATTAYVVERLVGASRVPDPIVEVVAGAGAFVGGAFGGMFVAAMLLGLAMPRIA